MNPTSILRGRPRLLRASGMAHLEALVHGSPTPSMSDIIWFLLVAKDEVSSSENKL
ncbi:hypothetical protein PAXRUDRAFT_826404 [Paxillus rubicundulus Ve08.2h10]|uniref:Uncharacterized protein n=1 Tax=Paxillus rubicundulus Ve08.2h10 TaxID=930991 RepID=A0A0D0DEQ1_9AGAM|nr:hypothetical protein PAXRUDRAFT_826404 [Paxillus rubicundulus Ve08.2h10]